MQLLELFRCFDEAGSFFFYLKKKDVSTSTEYQVSKCQSTHEHVHPVRTHQGVLCTYYTCDMCTTCVRVLVI